MNILFVGHLSEGQTSRERMKALRDLGNEVAGIESGPAMNPGQRIADKIARSAGFGYDYAGINRQIADAFEKQHFHLLWVEKGTLVKSSTLIWIKKRQPECRLAHLNPDDPFGSFRKGWSRFLKTIPLYDIHFVARTQNMAEYAGFGARRVVPYDRSYSKELHRPIALTAQEEERYRVPVGFVGTYAHDRARMIAGLIENGIPVAVYGNEWPNRRYWNIVGPHYRGPSRFGGEYAKIINGMGLALHFLRRENRDEQDSRTFEIPACRVCMIAERSRKHEELFQEDREAVFFETPDELLEKVRFYLAHPEQAKSIAEAGYRRCIESGYDHHSRMSALTELAMNTPRT